MSMLITYGDDNNFSDFNGNTIITISHINIREVALLFSDDSAVTFGIETIPNSNTGGYSSTISYSSCTGEENRLRAEEARIS